MNQWYTEGELLYKPELDIATPEFNKSYFPSPPSLKADIIETENKSPFFLTWTSYQTLTIVFAGIVFLFIILLMAIKRKY